MDDYELVTMEEVSPRRYVARVRHRGKIVVFHYNGDTGETFQEDDDGRLLSCACPKIIEEVLKNYPLDGDSIVGC